jgi:hypothetical protein
MDASFVHILRYEHSKSDLYAYLRTWHLSVYYICCEELKLTRKTVRRCRLANRWNILIESGPVSVILITVYHTIRVPGEAVFLLPSADRARPHGSEAQHPHGTLWHYSTTPTARAASSLCVRIALTNPRTEFPPVVKTKREFKSCSPRSVCTSHTLSKVVVYERVSYSYHQGIEPKFVVRKLMISIRVHRSLLLDIERTESSPWPLRVRGGSFWLNASIIGGRRAVPLSSYTLAFALRLRKIMDNLRVAD